MFSKFLLCVRAVPAIGRQQISKADLVFTILELNLRDHCLSIKGSDVDEYRLLEPFAFFPPGNEIWVPGAASYSVKNIGPVLSMNREGRISFPFSAPQEKLGNIHRSFCHSTDLLGHLPNWQRTAVQWHLMSESQHSKQLKS